MGLSIPAFHVSSRSQVKGGGTVFITSRKPGGFGGVFTIRIAAGFIPGGADLYPTGGFELKVDMNDGVNGGYKSTSIELINSHGKINPTVFLTGRCSGGSRELKGLRYWLMIADNQPRKASERETPDIVAFAIHDRTGARIAYGTGPLQPPGHIDVAPA